MPKEKQILQLLCKDYSQRKIAEVLQISRNMVAKGIITCGGNS